MAETDPATIKRLTVGNMVNPETQALDIIVDGPVEVLRQVNANLATQNNQLLSHEHDRLTESIRKNQQRQHQRDENRKKKARDRKARATAITEVKKLPSGNIGVSEPFNTLFQKGAQVHQVSLSTGDIMRDLRKRFGFTEDSELAGVQLDSDSPHARLIMNIVGWKRTSGDAPMSAPSEIDARVEGEGTEESDGRTETSQTSE